jgi:CO/xanthine dehydrogenase Mo-binding subunit
MPGGELVGCGYIRPSFDRGQLRRPPVFWEVGWGVAEAVVDEETGAVRVSRYVGVADVGRAINPALAEGQDEGAAVQGLGHTFWEAMICEGGQLLNGSLVEYRVPTFQDLPEMFEPCSSSTEMVRARTARRGWAKAASVRWRRRSPQPWPGRPGRASRICR